MSIVRCPNCEKYVNFDEQRKTNEYCCWIRYARVSGSKALDLAIQKAKEHMEIRYKYLYQFLKEKENEAISKTYKNCLNIDAKLIYKLYFKGNKCGGEPLC